MKAVTIYTDGACEGNPGPGGWAAILIYRETRREITGACPATTNNRMELAAALEGLSALKEPCEVDLYTDSRYVQQGMSNWIFAWKAKGWKRGTKPVMNADLWKALDAQAQRHQVRWHWIRGHNQHPENERCDRLAVAAIAQLRERVGKDELERARRAFRSAPAGLFEAAPEP